jgi:transformation/transcription domain-associated protein
MDNIPQMGTGQDLEMRAARIADPGVGAYIFEHSVPPSIEAIFSDLQTKYTVACELREMIDTVRDADSGRVLPQMVPALMDLLRSGEVAFHKDAREYHFRRVLIEILHRISCSDIIRGQAQFLFKGMLYLLRHDNEENGVTCCKTLIDLFRSFRNLTEELVSELMSIFRLVLQNMRELVDELLSEESALLDEKALLPSVRSFKVLAEMGMVIVTFSQSHRQMVTPSIQTTMPLNFEVLALESPAQKITRENYEAMGGFWAGMATTIKNHHAYVDFISAQIKVREGLYFLCSSAEFNIDGLLRGVCHAGIGRSI